MGVDRSDYIVYGWKLPNEYEDKNGEIIDVWDEKFDKLINFSPVKGTLVIIDDGMAGEYTVFGKLISSSCDTYEGWDFTPIDILNFPEEELNEEFFRTFNNLPPSAPSAFIFSKFS